MTQAAGPNPPVNSAQQKSRESHRLFEDDSATRIRLTRRLQGLRAQRIARSPTKSIGRIRRRPAPERAGRSSTLGRRGLRARRAPRSSVRVATWNRARARCSSTSAVRAAAAPSAQRSSAAALASAQASAQRSPCARVRTSWPQLSWEPPSYESPYVGPWPAVPSSWPCCVGRRRASPWRLDASSLLLSFLPCQSSPRGCSASSW